MSDVFLHQTNDDGDIVFENGDIVLDSGLETATYLSLFGGNNNDGNFDDSSKSWWANLSETDTESQYRSETQYILDSASLIPAMLQRIEDAANRDLQWMLDQSLVVSVSAVASIPAVDTLQLVINYGDVTFIFVERSYQYGRQNTNN